VSFVIFNKSELLTSRGHAATSQNVVGNIMIFIKNLTNFPAVKAFANKLRFDQVSVIDLGRTQSEN